MDWQDAVNAAAWPDLREKPVWTRSGGSGRIAHWTLECGDERRFVKQADVAHRDELAAEADALDAIRSTNTVRVPQVIASGCRDDGAYLAMEWLDLVRDGRDAGLGRALARLHATTSDRYGWHRDNTIGPTPQQNTWNDDWSSFFRDRRLRPQIELAARNGHDATLVRDGHRLLDRVPRLLDTHAPAASLLHGDLWSGNAGALHDGSPVVFDPSSYFGDREADIAMTELFGGFGAGFYAAYRQASPLAAGYVQRRTLYNLYHVLNHLNLFGGGYLARARSMVAELLAFR